MTVYYRKYYSENRNIQHDNKIRADAVESRTPLLKCYVFYKK